MTRQKIPKCVIERIRQLTKPGETYTVADIVSMLRARGRTSDAMQTKYVYRPGPDGEPIRVRESTVRPRVYVCLPSAWSLGCAIGKTGLGGLFESVGKGKDNRGRYRRVGA